MTQRRLWTAEEDNIITNLVSQHGTKKWTTVAQEMKKLMSSYSRTSKQIRQRWHNHLDPLVSKKEWSKKQQQILFDTHKQVGSRWKQIANKLQGRTDNHVKNYFYSTMRRALRRVNKFLGSKNSTTQMRTIRPSILSYLLDIADSDVQIRSLVANIREFSKWKPRGHGQGDGEGQGLGQGQGQGVFRENEREVFQVAINRLMQINEIYARKGNRKLKELEQLKYQQKTNYSLDQPSQLPKNNSITQSPHNPNNPNNLNIQEQQILEAQNNQATDQERQDQIEQQQQQRSWQDSNTQHCHILPQLQKPEYQCDLLTKKQESVVPTPHTSFCMIEHIWGPHASTDAVSLFEF